MHVNVRGNFAQGLLLLAKILIFSWHLNRESCVAFQDSAVTPTKNSPVLSLSDWILPEVASLPSRTFFGIIRQKNITNITKHHKYHCHRWEAKVSSQYQGYPHHFLLMLYMKASFFPSSL